MGLVGELFKYQVRVDDKNENPNLEFTLLKGPHGMQMDRYGKILWVPKAAQINNNSFEVNYELNYKNKIIGNQTNNINFQIDNLNEVCESRTFCLFEDIEKLKKLNLGKGGSLKNAIVIKNNKILNDGGLRNKLEFVNHKILDCMGDLFLSGYKIIGSLRCSQGGHKLTNQLLRKVFEDKSNYSLIEIKGKQLPHSFANYQNLKSIA